VGTGTELDGAELEVVRGRDVGWVAVVGVEIGTVMSVGDGADVAGVGARGSSPLGCGGAAVGEDAFGTYTGPPLPRSPATGVAGERSTSSGVRAGSTGLTSPDVPPATGATGAAPGGAGTTAPSGTTTATGMPAGGAGAECPAGPSRTSTAGGGMPTFE